MRQIKFRGKRPDFIGWVYGDLMTKPVHHDCCIVENGVINHSVDPETVGQFTGLKDKNGKEIYEGDRLRVVFVKTKIDDESVMTFTESASPVTIQSVFDYKLLDALTTADELEIIGNIHETNQS